MKQFDIISPYWGARSAIANSAIRVAAHFISQIPPDNLADRLQIYVDFYWEEDQALPLSMLAGKKPDRTIFWLNELLKRQFYEELPFDPYKDLVIDKTVTTSLSLRYALAIREWCLRKGYKSKLPKGDRQDDSKPLELTPFVICPYDTAVALIFKKCYERLDTSLSQKEVELLWYYLVVENGGFKAWKILTEKAGISIQLPEWSEIRIQLEKSLLTLLGQPHRKSGSHRKDNKGNLLSAT